MQAKVLRKKSGDETLSIGRRALAETAKAIRAQGGGRPDKDALVRLLEDRLVCASWTLRRLPDRERGFLQLRGSMWPGMLADSATYASQGLTSFQARARVRITAQEVDAMQPTLDLLQLLPDKEDRRIVFFAAWHQDGETGGRIPWARVRRSTGLSLSRWTFKRRYEAALRWLAALITLSI
ncbi:hypothetical protein [Kordiimonas aestuarii]|uniref:hypothetical protein n=1 Tax=Kordiimonas aestuarii TaxID=1005925 RepID=UPI0021D2EBE9|nr:hypothetical protein [Kordiimonas aestuarii]